MLLFLHSFMTLVLVAGRGQMVSVFPPPKVSLHYGAQLFFEAHQADHPCVLAAARDACNAGRPLCYIVKGAQSVEKSLPKAAICDVAGWADDVPRSQFTIEPSGVREIRVEGAVLKLDVLYATAAPGLDGTTLPPPRFLRLSIKLADGVPGNQPEEDFRDTARQVAISFMSYWQSKAAPTAGGAPQHQQAPAASSAGAAAAGSGEGPFSAPAPSGSSNEEDEETDSSAEVALYDQPASAAGGAVGGATGISGSSSDVPPRPSDVDLSNIPGDGEEEGRGHAEGGEGEEDEDDEEEEDTEEGEGSKSSSRRRGGDKLLPLGSSGAGAGAGGAGVLPHPLAGGASGGMSVITGGTAGGKSSSARAMKMKEVRAHVRVSSSVLLPSSMFDG